MRKVGVIGRNSTPLQGVIIRIKFDPGRAPILRHKNRNKEQEYQIKLKQIP